MEKINLVSLCSGYDSQALAFKKLGLPYDIVAWSEFDPESKRPLEQQPAVIAHDLLHPEAKGRNLGDMTKIDWAGWQKEHPGVQVDLLTYSTPCFVAGTLVITDKGEIPIEQIREGDLVLTHTGNYRRVVTPMVKKFYGNLYKVGVNKREVLCTPEHPFYVYNHEKEEFECVEARDLSAGWDVAIAQFDDDKNPLTAICEYNMTMMKREDYVLVYNMEVEGDHSYTANGIIVHNCQSISQAGLQHGIEEGSGTRSSILWFTENAIRELQPKYLLQENVKALVSKKFMPDFQKWCRRVEDLGYTNYWTVMNAKDYGIPQNRERVFMLSVRNDLGRKSFKFPEPWELDKTLADVLEDDVEQQFFLADSMVEKFLKNNENEGEDMVYMVTDHFLSPEEIENAIKEGNHD